MIDQNSQFQAILTAIGEAKQANADALGIPGRSHRWAWVMPTARTRSQTACKPN